MKKVFTNLALLATRVFKTKQKKEEEPQVQSSKLLDPQNNNSVKVHKLVDDSEFIHSSLGISEKRSGEIGRLCRKALIDHNDSVSCIVEVSEKLTHANELFFATWVLKNCIEERKHDHINGIIQEIFKGNKD